MREGPQISSGARVLIVDDERVIADSLAWIFALHGYETRAAYSAEQAAEIVSQWQPALVILDVVLPGMNGIDFAIQLNKPDPACRVLLFSGQLVTSSLVEAAQKKGHDLEVVAKPVHPTVLLDTATSLLASGPLPNV